MSRRSKRRKARMRLLGDTRENKGINPMQKHTDSRQHNAPNGKEKPTVGEVKAPEGKKQIEIRFPWLEFRKIRALVEKMDLEISGWCDAVVVEGRVQILRVAVPKQLVSSGHAEISARHSIECILAGELDAARAIVSWHSHNTMGAFVSGVDGPTFDSFARTMPIFVGLVTNKAGDWKAEVRVRTDVGVVVLDGKVTYEKPAEDPAVDAFVELGLERAVRANQFHSRGADTGGWTSGGGWTEGEYEAGYYGGYNAGGHHRGKFFWRRPGITCYEREENFSCDRSICSAKQSKYSIQLDAVNEVGFLTYCEDCMQDIMLWLTSKDRAFCEKLTKKMLREEVPSATGAI